CDRCTNCHCPNTSDSSNEYRHFGCDVGSYAHHVMADHAGISIIIAGVSFPRPVHWHSHCRFDSRAPKRNAAMGDQMTERFSAPGATLVKLFGEQDHEANIFAARSDSVRSSGVQVSVWTSVFMTMVTLVSSLALAAVYGIGGYQALTGSLNAGDVVTMALLLTRLYAPLTGLATARVELMSALVSFDRIFEVLDLKPMI